MRSQYEVGIDEAGRGPLAGPVAVGVAKVPYDFDWDLIPGVGDSKALSPKRRQLIFEHTKQLKRDKKLDFVVMLASAKEIDKKGIAVVIRELVARGLVRLGCDPVDSFVKLDGSLSAPSQYKQETIIKGDSKELIIGLASICAKETRDREMEKLAKQYSGYELEIHKGYGTKKHRQLIYRMGMSEVHRQSYCQNRSLWGKLS